MSEPAAPARFRVRRWLTRAPAATFSTYAAFAAFTAYFCMYAFRKPFAAAEYAGASVGPLSLKDALIISQVCGYALSKFAGIKLCSEIAPGRRAAALVALVAVSELALVAFGLVPDAWKLAAIFANGLPLGMIWGLVFGFLEGRRTTDFLGAALCCSFIVASGFVKSAGRWWMAHGVPEAWMPAVTGLTFFVPLCASAWLLHQLPAPDPEDERERSRRSRMPKELRRSFLRANFLGLAPLLLLYVCLTAYRDFRDNYAREIWSEMGLGDQVSIYTVPEVAIALAVLALMAFLILVRRNRSAVIVVYGMMAAGVAVVGLATLALDRSWIGAPAWMTTIGFGLYLAYVPYNFALFDRLVAFLRTPGNAVFGIYVADALGYTGSIGMVLYKHFGHAKLSKVEFFRGSSYVLSVLCLACLAASLCFFLRRRAPEGIP